MIRPKQVAIRALTEHRLFPYLPPGAARTYATLRYHGQNSTRRELGEVAQGLPRIATRYGRLGLAAARAAFRTGYDHLVEQALPDLERRPRTAAGALLLRADLLAYHGEYDEAMRSAEQARRLAPTSAAACAAVVKLAYQSCDRAYADQVAVDAVHHFPRNRTVMWAVARASSSPAQYQRIQSAWDECAEDPYALLRNVRQLAMAASRAGEVGAARQLYCRAIELALERGYAKSGRNLTGRGFAALAGRNAWIAMEDLHRTLENAGVPYFFAAGTALGLVREGRPLSADNDIDVGILEEDWDREALIALFTKDPLFDVTLHPQSQKVHLRHRGGSPVDLFKFYRDGTKLWHDGVFVRWHNTPFTIVSIPVRGVSLPVPADPDLYLTENYGEWRVPNSAFDPFTDDAPNVEVTWPEYHQMHFVRRAYRRVMLGEFAAAAADLESAGEPELGAHVRTKVRK